MEQPLMGSLDHVAPLHGGRIIPATPKQRIRKLLMFVTVCATVAAFCAVAAGYGAKPSRVQRAELALTKAEVGSNEAEAAYKELKRTMRVQEEEENKMHLHQALRKAEEEKQAEVYAMKEAKAAPVKIMQSKKFSKLDEEAPPADADATLVVTDETATESSVPDPEEAKKAAAKMAAKAGNDLGAFGKDVSGLLDTLLPGGDLLHAFSWHLDLCLYIMTMYGVYYIWRCELWKQILPMMTFNMIKQPELTSRTIALKNRECNIGQWAERKVDNEPCDYDLLWFRKAKGEVAHFIDSKRVMPGLIDTLMCGCGGNMYAVAVTNKRIIVQNDKRCLFGSTVLTTNEDSVFIENVHKASLFTDGSLNLGVTVLHSADMLRGGFMWIFAGFVIDIILEWKPTWIKMIGDARLEGSGIDTYMRKFELPVGKAYQMYDGIMRGMCEADDEPHKPSN